MSYTALYRKWRPKNFNDVIGQEHITTTLKNEIKNNRISHSYLFCGTRGTGKTSTAKIFSKAVNCHNLKDGEPCNECEVCENISLARSMNVIEIDAASNNGVDNIRQIREEVKYPPTEGNYKVYIIDEVHMLSVGAFNALLKTLEEPPSHVIFILATTDPQKIPATILSRCQRYDFKRISINDMTNRLDYFMKEENINVELKALRYIAKISDGAMRDALSILDQCIAFYYGQDITLEKVLDTIGAVDNEVFYNLTNAIIDKNIVECLNIVDNIIVQGRDIGQFISQIIIHFRNLLVSKNSANNIIDSSQENVAKLLEQSNNIEQNNLINLIQQFSSLESQLKYSGNDRTFLEVLLIKLCKEQEQSYDYNDLINRISNLEQNTTNPKSPVVKKNVEPKPKAIPEDIKAAIKIWSDIKTKFVDPLKSMLVDTKVGYLDNNLYYIRCNDVVCKGYIEKNLDKIEKEFENLTNKTFELKPILEEEFQRQYQNLYGVAENTNTNDNEFNSLLSSLHLENVNVETID